jgi:hypothetical protein
MKWLGVALLAGSAAQASLVAQQQTRALVTERIDESRLVSLAGSVHPLAQTRYDRGAVDDSFRADRIVLLLGRSAEQQAALDSFLQAAHASGSANYHHWLTPEQFGEQFGPADADIETASRWLSAHGMQVTRIAKGRQYVEFSATAGQLRDAFHTEIHRYEIDGETHFANASAIEIPQALALLIRGVSPLNDFHAQPQIRIAGRATMARESRPGAPEWTAPNGYGTANKYQYNVTPADFATQYDLNPLYKAGVNGTGQTIGIINESNINLSLVSNFQKLFGTAGTTPQVVIDGDDPGVLTEGNVATEAYLDVELSGAVAPGATIDLYIADGGTLIDPLELAALRAVEDNQATVLSVSFGECEQNLGDAGNLFWAELWEQAAAQGQTVLVAAGDYGSECRAELGTLPLLSVNGLASTSWDVAVGGTDFYYSDYASGGASANQLWNTKNTAQLGSLKAPIEEQPWNDPFGLDIISDGIQDNEIYAGGGGKSSCTTLNAATQACLSGYAKPSWQAGKGVPADRVRDLPDVSLFASNGPNLSAYAICAYEGECAPGKGASAEVLLAGGTSASTPAMAGIMALVDQKYGRQGQANFTLYPLAKQKPGAFHDITVGSNSVPCGSVADANCVLQPNGYYGSPQYKATAGYDLASGLGSVDASELVDNWKAITFRATKTGVAVSKTHVTHGTPITVTASVAPTSGTGTPTGEVAILAATPLPANESQFYMPLTKGAAKSTVSFLPGGEYALTARYGGDTTFAASLSKPVTLTIDPENSNINFLAESNGVQLLSGESVQFGAPVQLSIQPAGVSAADGIATGSATFTIDGKGETVALNSSGAATWLAPALSVGAHTASAVYSGDTSFKASTSEPISFMVTKGQAVVSDTVFAPTTIEKSKTGATYPWLYLAPGSSMTVTVTAQGASGANPTQIPLNLPAPSGTVKICLGAQAGSNCMSPAYSNTVPLAALKGNNAETAAATATFTSLQPGTYFVSALYNGDTNWGDTQFSDAQQYVVSALPPLAKTTTALTISTTNIQGAATATVTAQVKGTGNGTSSPKGILSFYANDIFVTYVPLSSDSGATTKVSILLNANSFPTSGFNQLKAEYEGDGRNGPSLSNAITVLAGQTVGDFTLAPEIPQISVAAKGSTSTIVNLGSLTGFDGTVSLSCTTSSKLMNCSVSPAAVALHGTATAKVTVITKNAPAGTDGVVVTGTANGYIHNAKIGVVIP